MIRILSLIILSLIFGKPLFGQSDTIIIRIGDDSLKAVGKYLNRIEEGGWEYFYMNGGKQSKGMYLNGKPIGEWTNWLPDGRILNMINYDKNGLKHGLFIEYSYSSSETHEMYFVNDSLEGKIIWRHFDGHKIIEGYYTKGLRSGRWNWYHKNGKFESEGSFLNDKLHGLCIYYFENGEKDTEGNFENGLKDGEWIFYFENTSGIRARGTYINDVKEGKWILYNTDGSINSVETYEKDVLKQ